MLTLSIAAETHPIIRQHLPVGPSQLHCSGEGRMLHYTRRTSVKFWNALLVSNILRVSARTAPSRLHTVPVAASGMDPQVAQLIVRFFATGGR
jgi:hypothetical protein